MPTSRINKRRVNLKRRRNHKRRSLFMMMKKSSPVNLRPEMRAFKSERSALSKERK